MSRTVGAVEITDEQIEEVISRLCEGLTLKQSCKKSKFSYPNIVRRIGSNPALKQLHAHAREEYVRVRVQDMHDIAKNPRIDPKRARVMIDVIKWESARVLPKEFGDRVQQEVIITNNTTLSTRMAAARARARAKQAEEAIASQLPPDTN
jgi:Holliday junction resolvasome RuvABC DNA-binding subunit